MANGTPKKPDEALIRQVCSMFEMFHRGPLVKITKTQLGERVGTNPRVIEMAVFELRRRGVPILADGEGYWYADNPAEFEHVLNSLRHRLAKVHGTLKALEFAREKMLAQARREPNGQGRLVFNG